MSLVGEAMLPLGEQEKQCVCAQYSATTKYFGLGIFAQLADCL